MKLAWTPKIEEALRKSIRIDIASGKIKNYYDLVENMWEVAKRATEYTHTSKFNKRNRNVQNSKCFVNYKEHFVKFVYSDGCKNMFIQHGETEQVQLRCTKCKVYVKRIAELENELREIKASHLKRKRLQKINDRPVKKGPVKKGPVKKGPVKKVTFEFLVAGLMNTHLNCWLNALMQSLNSTRTFADAVIDVRNQPRGLLVNDIRKLFLELRTQSLDPVHPYALMLKLQTIESGFKINQMEDVEEAFVYIMNRLQRESPCLWPILDSFKSSIVMKCYCSACGNVKLESTPFISLRLPIPTKENVELVDCFATFLEEKHTTCSCSSPTSELRCLETAPEVMCLTLGRIILKNSICSKNKAYVKFPIKNLDLTKFVFDREQSIYNLSAIIEHCGSSSGGHYFSYVLKQNKWIKCNDTNVYTVEEEEVSNALPYMLIYEKI